MKKALSILAFVITASIYAYPFTVPYFDEEFFLYPYLNYDQTTEWKRAREGRLFEGGFVQTTHGSQTTWLLMSSEEAVINKNIGENFIFRFRYKNLESRHLSHVENVSTVGIGYRLNDRVTVTGETDLESRKEEIDISAGALFTFQTVYAHIGITFDDFLFDIKNIGDGKNLNTPVSLTSNIRFYLNRLYFYLSGRYGTGFDRVWEPGPFTDRLKHSQNKMNFYGRIEYDITDRLRLYGENFYDSFSDGMRFKDSTLDISEYSFSAVLYNFKLGGILAVNERNSVEPGICYARTEHEFDLIDGQALDNGHKKSYTIDYPALLPYLIYKYRIHTKFTAELSYMGCYTQKEPEDNYFYIKSGEKYWDKELLKLGLEYRFSPNCSLYISAGQLINTGVFGGGNARFNLTF